MIQMKNRLTFLLLSILFFSACEKPVENKLGLENLTPDKVELTSNFKEDFSNTSSEYFNFRLKTIGDDFRYYSGFPSLSEKNTKVMLFRIDPSDVAGSSRGAEISTKGHSFYGSYSGKLRIPDVTEVQPNVGAIVGLITQDTDSSFGLSEIRFEWLIANPSIVYIGAKTGVYPKENRIIRVVNLAEGKIYRTSYESVENKKGGIIETKYKGDFSGDQNYPQNISAIENFDASKKFHQYGFDWYPDRIVWWILDEKTQEKLILWDYKATEIFAGEPAPSGIPVVPSRLRMNFWHSKIRPVQLNPSSIETPRYPYELEADWISYEPFTEMNEEWYDKQFK